MARDLRALLSGDEPVVLVEVVSVQGSVPREAGAWMLVTGAAKAGTIGGGQLEYIAIDRARQMLRRGTNCERLIVPLGPDIGQCCGGRMTLALTEIDAGLAATLRRRLDAEAAGLPQVLVFGAGHVGRALAAALTLLPVRTVLIDQRAEELALAPAGVETRRSPLPEAEAAAAAPGSAFVVLTHDHALDFLVAAAALARGDATYVGLIGSKTKRARFRAWRMRSGARPDAALRGLTCPIGGPSGDKRPAVIAALVAAEIITRLGARTPELTAATRGV
ncbi:MAG: xanthine dehydrogenase accessory protein XdhC [Rhodobacteraceae bacterium]|nr:xanthine dehydrogenase accessory protein XdhC [Paracoccaceae bacterium]